MDVSRCRTWCSVLATVRLAHMDLAPQKLILRLIGPDRVQRHPGFRLKAHLHKQGNPVSTNALRSEYPPASARVGKAIDRTGLVTRVHHHSLNRHRPAIEMPLLQEPPIELIPGAPRLSDWDSGVTRDLDGVDQPAFEPSAPAPDRGLEPVVLHVHRTRQDANPKRDLPFRPLLQTARKCP